MSSDSEDDCYGNIAQKLQSIKSQYYNEDKVQTKSLDTSLDTAKTAEKVVKIVENSSDVACVELKDGSDSDEMSLDTIIAQHSKKKAVRRSKRNADISTDNIIQTPGRKRARSTRNSNKSVVTVDLNTTVENASDTSSLANKTTEIVENTTVNAASRGKTRGRRRGRGRRGANNSQNTTVNPSTVDTTTNVTLNSSSLTTSTDTLSNETLTSPVVRSRGRGRGGGRGRRSTPRRTRNAMINQFLSQMFGLRSSGHSNIPTYSVGNTYEYPDECQDQPLFNSNQTKKDDVVIVENEVVEELNDSLDENEELSVKIYWQNRECVKFTIRRFQKLQTVFDFFANREKVSHDHLYFSYNDKILNIDDTPDSIAYNEVKFIDGGIINQSISTLAKYQHQDLVKNGIKLKFQCQNIKKPYEVYIRPEDKLSVAMIQCAEHIEKPLDKLKFIFDGDVITGKSTPNDLDLEGGECIDVKIIS